MMSLSLQTSTIDQREQSVLAPYATFSRDTLGRAVPEAEHAYRGPFQRDRDRIVHAQAFRRLSGKLQVFARCKGDYHRTRLTHTMEVASISRTIGRALALNEDLIEALALLHDIGHPPFGHAGEEALSQCLPGGQRFSHNAFALTIVEELECPYAKFPGLNLSHEVLAGQRHRVAKQPSQRVAISLEAQVVDVADSITYDAHDCDDAVKLNLLRLDELMEVELVRRCMGRLPAAVPDLPDSALRRQLVRTLIDLQVADLLAYNAPQFEAANWDSAATAASSGFRLSHSPEICQLKDELEGFLYQRVYRHPELVALRDDAQRRIGEMVDRFAVDPCEMPDFFGRRAGIVGALTASIEYVAGMTDRYFDQIHAQMFGPETGWQERAEAN